MSDARADVKRKSAATDKIGQVPPAPPLASSVIPGKMALPALSAAVREGSMLQAQVERIISEHELFLKLVVTISGGW